MAEPLKHLFPPTMAQDLAALFADRCPTFDAAGFTGLVLRDFESLELKERSRRITEGLAAFLPAEFPAAADVIRRSLGPPIDETGGVGRVDETGFNGWAAVPVSDFVADAATEPGDLDLALRLIRELTKRFSAEFAIRPFLLRAQDETLAVLETWVQDPDRHVRRLVSEGSRPRLPWAPRLPAFIADPAPTIALLERLKDDPEEYVRRSVANHLNDIAKDHPDRVAAIAARWLEDADKNRRKLVRHACRTLIKDGHPGALAALGFGPAALDVQSFSASPEVRFGAALEIALELKSTDGKPKRIALDYVIHHRKANGTTAPKVFKWREFDLAPGAAVAIQKRHVIRPITTRKYYAGAHRVEAQANGEVIASAPFELIMPSN